MKTGIELIAEERKRQIEKEGYTAQHDYYHQGGELTIAAACYAFPEDIRMEELGGIPPIPDIFPFDDEFWKPTPNDRIKELTKAGALIAAEIDRLQNNISKNF